MTENLIRFCTHCGQKIIQCRCEKNTDKPEIEAIKCDCSLDITLNPQHGDPKNEDFFEADASKVLAAMKAKDKQIVELQARAEVKKAIDFAIRADRGTSK